MSSPQGEQERFPTIAACIPAQAWVQLQRDFGRAPHTVDAYTRALEDYLSFCSRLYIHPESARRDDIAKYVHDLSSRPNSRGLTRTSGISGAVGMSGTSGSAMRVLDPGIGPAPAPGVRVGLANATMHQRLTVVRLFYDYLMEEGLRQDNPVGRGRYTAGRGFGGHRDRALIPHYRKLPWIPDEQQWKAVLEAAREEPLRNRVMLALAYDAGLRREELCSLSTSDVDPAHRLLHIRAEHTKGRRARTVPYSEATSVLYMAYLNHRREVSRARGRLFLSESHRNHAQPISIWTWSKVVEGLADRSGVDQFTTHTPRHLCLTDLARAGWDLHEIATFAGHRSIQSTLLYIHLSGRELSAKLAQGMAEIHAWRVSMLGEVLA